MICILHDSTSTASLQYRDDGFPWFGLKSSLMRSSITDLLRRVGEYYLPPGLLLKSDTHSFFFRQTVSLYFPEDILTTNHEMHFTKGDIGKELKKKMFFPFHWFSVVVGMMMHTSIYCSLIDVINQAFLYHTLFSRAISNAYFNVLDMNFLNQILFIFSLIWRLG